MWAVTSVGEGEEGERMKGLKDIGQKGKECGFADW